MINESLPPEYCEIPLMNGGVALVDEDDVCRVDEYRWYKFYNEGCRTWYARAYVRRPDGSKTVLFMHRVVFGLTHEDRITVDHKNHDGLDNRRSFNLRLASYGQNTTNQRKRRVASSKYKGVIWHKANQKWMAAVSTPRQGRAALLISIGFYEIEEEAAFAHHVAAPLVREVEFLHLVPIPPEKMPSPERQEEIKKLVMAKIKAKLAGKKGILSATSDYTGVCYLPKENQWRAHKNIGGKMVYFGFFTMELEAAFAYNYGISLINSKCIRINNVSESDLESLERAQEIRNEVFQRVKQPGTKVQPSATSRFWGVSYSKKRRTWIAATTKPNRSMFQIGEFHFEIEAAIAYNFAIPALNNPNLKPNVIPEDRMPTTTRVEEIRLKVANRLKALVI